MSAYSIATRGLAGRKIPQGVLAPMNALLFGSGEQGAWYDPSDLSTLFQDSAGTTPVTAVEQPVGRMLDKSGRGNHATQATTTKRPIYSRLVNLINSNSLSSWAAQVGTVLSISANPGVYPGSNVFKVTYDGSGVSGGYRIYAGGVLSVTGTPYTSKIWLRADTPTTIRFSGNSVAGAFTVCNLTTEWQPFEISGVGNGVSVIQNLIYSAAGDNSPFEIYMTACDARRSIDNYLPYQRVNTATDYDADPNKFPAYLRFDGVDDAMQTGNIDFTSTDKMTVWAGVAPYGANDQARIVELGVNASAYPGFALETLSMVNPTYRGELFGSSRGVVDTPTYPIPNKKVVSAQYDIAGTSLLSEIKIRLDGADVVNSPTFGSAGTGNFPNAALSVGARTGSAAYFTGHIYSLIIRGAQSSLSQIEATELYIKQKMRMP